MIAPEPLTSSLATTAMRPNATDCDQMRPNATAVASVDSVVNAQTSSTSAADDQPACDQNAEKGSAEGAESELSPVPAATSSACDQNATGRTTATLFELTSQQHHALELLSQGLSTPQVARRLQLHRATIHRWKTRHPRFIAELSRRMTATQVDAAAEARQVLDLATKILHKRLRSRNSENLALRLLASPRLARLAATKSTPATLQQTLHDLQQSRSLQPSDDLPPQSDTALLQGLLDELEAPLPPAAAPKQSAEPSPEEQLRALWAQREPRKDLLTALERYNLPLEDVGVIARRPDLTPLDIHYWAHISPHFYADFVAQYLRTYPPAGTDRPLDAVPLVALAEEHLISRIGPYDLSHYHLTRCANTLILTMHNTGHQIQVDAGTLWRNDIVP